MFSYIYSSCVNSYPNSSDLISSLLSYIIISLGLILRSINDLTGIHSCIFYKFYLFDYYVDSN